MNNLYSLKHLKHNDLKGYVRSNRLGQEVEINEFYWI